MNGWQGGREIFKCYNPLVIGLFGMYVKKLVNINVCVSASLNRWKICGIIMKYLANKYQVTPFVLF